MSRGACQGEQEKLFRVNTWYDRGCRPLAVSRTQKGSDPPGGQHSGRARANCHFGKSESSLLSPLPCQILLLQLPNPPPLSRKGTRSARRLLGLPAWLFVLSASGGVLREHPARRRRAPHLLRSFTAGPSAPPGRLACAAAVSRTRAHRQAAAGPATAVHRPLELPSAAQLLQQKRECRAIKPRHRGSQPARAKNTAVSEACGGHPLALEGGTQSSATPTTPATRRATPCAVKLISRVTPSQSL